MLRYGYALKSDETPVPEGTRVEIFCYGPDGNQVPTVTEDGLLVAHLDLKTDVDGYFEAELPRNLDIIPAGTVWRVVWKMNGRTVSRFFLSDDPVEENIANTVNTAIPPEALSNFVAGDALDLDPSLRLDVKTDGTTLEVSADKLQVIPGTFVLPAELGTAAAGDLGVDVASLVSGKVPLEQLPPLNVGQVFVANSDAEMIALPAVEGDVCKRTDIPVTYMLSELPPDVLANWVEISADAVTMVNGQVGVVTIDLPGLGAGEAAEKDVDVPLGVPTIDASGKLATSVLSTITIAGLDVGTALDGLESMAMLQNGFTVQITAEMLRDFVAESLVGGAFLPLAGGELTGPLVGTSADFSGAVDTGALTATSVTTGALVATSGAFSDDLLVTTIGDGSIQLKDDVPAHGVALFTVSGFGPGMQLYGAYGDSQAKVQLLAINSSLGLGPGGGVSPDWIIARSGTAQATITGTTIMANTTHAGAVAFANAINISFGSTTGTQIGTSPTDKFAFWGGTPIARPANNVELRTLLLNVGLLPSGGANDLNLNGGDLTADQGTFAGTVTFNGNLTFGDGVNVDFGSTNGTVLGGSGDKIAVLGSAAVAKVGATNDIKDSFVSYGWLTDGGATPLNLDGGALTVGALSAAAGTFSGNLLVSVSAGASIEASDGTASHGRALLTDSGFGAGMQIYGNTGDSQAKIQLLSINTSIGLGPGGGTSVDVIWSRTGTAAGQIDATSGITFTGPVIHPAGSASAASVRGSDADTGLYFPSANNVVAAANARDMIAIAGAAAGSGTVTVLDKLIAKKGTSGQSASILEAQDDAGTAYFRVTSGGYPEVKAGGSNYYRLGGTLNVQESGATGNVGTGEDDIAPYTLPAGIMAVNKDVAELEAGGVVANNANTKTLRVKLGTSNICQITLTPSATYRWSLRVRVVRVTATSQKYQVWFNASNATANALLAFDTGALAETMANALAFKITADATTTDDVTCTFAHWKFYPAI